MALSIGIVGLPNVGKSTLFKALTKNNVLIANYPFATIEPNTGVVAVPDARLLALADLFQPQKVTPATISFTDIAGLIAGAHRGEGLGNKFLAHIRETDAICLVSRAFTDSDVTHVTDEIDAAKEIETIKTELILADLEALNSSLPKFNKLSKGQPELAPEVGRLQNYMKNLNAGEWPDTKLEFDNPELRGLANSLLTTKSIVYVFNIDEATLKDEQKRQELAKLVAPAEPIFISAKLESELAELTEAEAQELLESLGLKHPGLESLIRVGYKTLGLETYFTAGEPEVKAWTINVGSSAPEAAGKIHTDFQKGFVAAEVIDWQKLIDAGGWSEAKAKGLVRNEGKDYTVQDGDVINFKFNL